MYCNDSVFRLITIGLKVKHCVFRPFSLIKVVFFRVLRCLKGV